MINIGHKCTLVWQPSWELEKLKKTGNLVHPRLILQFHADCKLYLSSMAKKLVERSPVQYPLVKQAHSLNPKTILSSTTTALKLMTNLVRTFAQEGILLDPSEGDLIVRQFRMLLDDTKFKIGLKSFCASEDRLDDFYYELCVKSSQKYPNLWKIIRKVMILSHGNATVESGFSIQKDQLIENLKEETMIAKRRVYDAVNEGNIPNLVSEEMIKATYGANAGYTAAMEEKRRSDREGKEKDMLRKRKAIEVMEAREKEKTAEMNYLNAKKRRRQLEDSF